MWAGRVNYELGKKDETLIFEYEELRECVEEDFGRFFKMGFNAEQIYPAVLNEYEHGEDYSLVEEVCIHVFLSLLYVENKMDSNVIHRKLDDLLTDNAIKELQNALGEGYLKFENDLNRVKNY